MATRRRKRARKGKLELKKILPQLYAALPYVVVAVIVIMIFMTVRNFLSKNSYFNIKHIDIYVDGKIAPSNLRSYYLFQASSNILDTNLRVLEARLKKEHPEVKNLTITTCLPDRLRMDVVSRRQFAQLRSDKYYPVDNEGMVLADVRDEPLPNLPAISGAEGIQGRFLIGQKCSTINLKQAYALLGELRHVRFIRAYKLHHIDCSDPRNLSFYLGDYELEIRMGDKDFAEKLSLLAAILDKIGPDAANMKYIDLRFKDPVVGPRLKK